MTELVITRGLPASGKTTFAKAWVAEDPEHRARVNRDSIRAECFFQHGVLDRALEDQVTRVQRAAVGSLLAAGYSVVVDDMHLRASYIRDWQEYARARNVGVRIEDRFLLTPVDECVRRDEERIARGERGVTGDVIRNLARRFGSTLAGNEPPPELVEADTYVYEPDTALPRAWMVDLDGTLALMSNRGPFEWHRVGEDTLNQPVADLLLGIANSGAYIIAMSGRDAVCRPQTESWLLRHDIPYDTLFMRAEGDNRNDAIVKLELFQEHVASHYNVQGVLDDRARVVQMWRKIGLFCAQVAPGDF